MRILSAHSRRNGHRNPLNLHALLLGAALLLGTSHAAKAHGLFAACVMRGPAGFEEAYVGQSVNLGFGFYNLCTQGDTVSVTELRVVIHHASGSVTITNLLDRPLLMTNPVARAYVGTNFTVLPGDGEWLAVDWSATWTDTPRSGVGALSGRIEYRTHFRVVPQPALVLRPLGSGWIRVSWPDTAPCRLETSAGIGQPWTPCTIEPSWDGGEKAVTVNCSGSPVQLFRLAPYFQEATDASR